MVEGGVVFRADGSRELGLGHIVRSMEVASILKKRLGPAIVSTPIWFVTRRDESVAHFFQSSEFAKEVRWIPWEGDELGHFSKILDELSPALVVTDIDLRGRVYKYYETIFPAVHFSLHEHNFPIVAGDRIFAPTIRPMVHHKNSMPGFMNFSGPQYVLLSAEINKLRERFNKSSATVGKVVITMGGADPGRLTEKVLTAVRTYNNPDIEWDVVLGPASGYVLNHHNGDYAGKINFINGADIKHSDFLGLLADADAVITNAGTTLYESLALGRPTLAIPQNPFESEVARLLSDQGACLTPAGPDNFSILESISVLVEDRMIRTSIARKGSMTVDGKGAHRVSEQIVEFLLK